MNVPSQDMSPNIQIFKFVFVFVRTAPPPLSNAMDTLPLTPVKISDRQYLCVRSLPVFLLFNFSTFQNVKGINSSKKYVTVKS